MAGRSARARPAAGEVAGLETVVEGRRQLFRVRYQGPDGGGSLRLALLEVGHGDYQARASDSFGRALWSLELAGDRATFVDHRQGLYCASGHDLRIPQLALGALPLDRLPAVLGGELPAMPVRPGADPSDFVDAEGRRWTSTRSGSVVQAWSLWAEDRPLLWWRRHEQGGILSHRDGAQFRWRRSVSEALTSAPTSLAVPSGYLRATCAELSAVP